jgi:hypothetical protein
MEQPSLDISRLSLAAETNKRYDHLGSDSHMLAV